MGQKRDLSESPAAQAMTLPAQKQKTEIKKTGIIVANQHLHEHLTEKSK